MPRKGTLYALCALLALVVAACDGTSSATHPAATQTARSSPTSTIAPTQTPTAPKPPTINAPIAYLYDPLTGAVYLSRNADQEVAMASTTKIMTALVAITYGKLDTLITVGADAVGVPSGSSLAFLKEGDKIPLRDLLYALLLPSGDDAAVAIADGVAGSQANFVALMNAEAALLGLTHTHYTDVHGLDAPGCDYAHLTGFDPKCLYTTAADLAHLAAFAMRSPLFATVVGTPEYTLAATATHAAYDWSSTNDLFSSFAYDGVTGVKTGSEVASGYCLVFSAARAQGHLLGVVLHDGNFDDPDPNEYFWRFMDATTLLDWGFSQQLAVAQHWTSMPPGNAP
jgi:serine-type D-Ala-D-Ala carboxypeptidase (penicillin-binding protein 5/6)